MFGIPETLPYSETLFFLSLSLFLSSCPALLPPIRNSASQDPLRACVSCLSCLVSFSPHGRTTTLFHSFSRYRHQSITKATAYSSPRPLGQNEMERGTKEREFTSIAASDHTQKSRCICIIVHTIQYIHIYNSPFRCCLLLFVVFSTTTTKPAPPLPCHKKQRKKQRQKKRVQPSFHLVTAPGLPLYLFRSHSLPFWEVAQVQYIYTYYDSRKKLYVDSLLPG